MPDDTTIKATLATLTASGLDLNTTLPRLHLHYPHWRTRERG